MQHFRRQGDSGQELALGARSNRQVARMCTDTSMLDGFSMGSPPAMDIAGNALKESGTYGPTHRHADYKTTGIARNLAGTTSSSHQKNRGPLQRLPIAASAGEESLSNCRLWCIKS